MKGNLKKDRKIIRRGNKKGSLEGSLKCVIRKVIRRGNQKG
jgi:hypothetical protein